MVNTIEAEMAGPKTTWMALVLTLGAPNSGASEPSFCLPPQAGEIVSALIDQGRIARAVPAGWQLTSAEIVKTKMVLYFSTAEGNRLALQLGHPISGSRPAGWFSFQLDPDIQGDERSSLEDVVSLIDTAFPECPWIPCQTESTGSDGNPGWYSSPLFFLILGGLQLAVLVFGCVWILWKQRS